MSKFSIKRVALIGGLSLSGVLIFLIVTCFSIATHFRTMQDEISSLETVNLKGLRELQASGGAAPDFGRLQEQLSHIKKKVKIVVDADSESFGYLNGVSTSFLGYGLPRPRFRHFVRRLFLTGTFFERPERIILEAEEAKNHGFEYVKASIGSKYTAVNEDIDKTIAFLDHLPKDVWVHIHCANGTGRTSMLLVMLDMIRNAPQVSLEDIVKRQHLLGSVDLFNTAVWKRGATYTKSQLENRKEFIEKFYKFIVQRNTGGIQLWSEWNRQNKHEKSKETEGA